MDRELTRQEEVYYKTLQELGCKVKILLEDIPDKNLKKGLIFVKKMPIFIRINQEECDIYESIGEFEQNVFMFNFRHQKSVHQLSTDFVEKEKSHLFTDLKISKDY